MSNFRSTATLCLALTACVASSGCVSLEHAFDPDEDFQIYGGVKQSSAYLTNAESPFFGQVFRLIDFPLTVALDTVLLPISIPVDVSRGGAGG